MIEARFLRDICISLLAGAIAGLVAASLLSGCTPAQQQTLSNTTQATLTGVKIAACVQGVLAEQEQARALASRLAETAAELEAERISEAAREHPDSVKTEIEKVLRDGGQ